MTSTGTPGHAVVPDGARPTRRSGAPAAAVALVLALTAAAAVTLRPVGDGWSWGAPAVEVAWYLDGLSSPAVLRQLLGNVLLLAPAAAAAVLAVPRSVRPWRLAPAAVLAAVSIETSQWLLPLGRVVSPTDAVLNAAGAVLAGLVTVRVRRRCERVRGTRTVVGRSYGPAHDDTGARRPVP